MIVGGIRIALHVKSREEAGRQASLIKALPNVLRRVVQRSVSDQKIHSAGRQIFPVHGGQSAGRKRSRYHITLSLPVCAFERDSATRQAVNGRECETLGLAVVPAEANEHSEIVGNRLIKT